MLTIEEKMIADIPCFEIAEADEEPLAELVLYHGWGSNAEKQRFRGQLLAAFGYRVIVPEISGHGVRGVLAGVFRDDAAAFAALASDEGVKLRSALGAFDPAQWSARGITTPVLLTNGSLDQTLPASLNADFLAQQQLPQVRQVLIEDAGHVVTDSALREVVAFIESHR